MTKITLSVICIAQSELKMSLHVYSLSRRHGPAPIIQQFETSDIKEHSNLVLIIIIVIIVIIVFVVVVNINLSISYLS
jgi:hypothetical protein